MQLPRIFEVPIRKMERGNRALVKLEQCFGDGLVEGDTTTSLGTEQVQAYLNKITPY